MRVMQVLHRSTGQHQTCWITAPFRTKVCPWTHSRPRLSFGCRRRRTLVALVHARSISHNFLRRIAGQLSHPRGTHRGANRGRKIRKGWLRSQMDLCKRPRAHLCRTSSFDVRTTTSVLTPSFHRSLTNASCNSRMSKTSSRP